VSPDYTLPAGIVITGKDAMTVDSKPFGKEDGGLLYVPEIGKVCVLGTFDSLSPLDDEFDVAGIHNSQISDVKLSACPLS
jgi:hypothetical protein